MKTRVVFIVLIFLISCQSNQKNRTNEFFNLIANIESLLNNNPFNGIVLVKNSSSTVYSKVIGYSDLENKTPLHLIDQFVIGSISKQITAVLILREYEQGNLILEDKIKRYLPDIKQPWSNEVTIHHLLTHTHGIISLDVPLEFTAGSQFQYSQLGYDLLAQILESVTTKSFQKLSTELFKEYELTQTFHPGNKNYKHLVKGYQENQEGNLEFAENSFQNYTAAGSFISNAGDLSQWNHLLHSNVLVKQETLELMKTNFATREHQIFEAVEYGYGLLFKDGEQNKQIGALGYAPGFISASYYYPKTQMNLIVLENTARNLNDFKLTFKVHTELMKLIKKYNE